MNENTLTPPKDAYYLIYIYIFANYYNSLTRIRSIFGDTSLTSDCSLRRCGCGERQSTNNLLLSDCFHERLNQLCLNVLVTTLEVQADYFLNGFSVKTIVLVGIYNQQFKGTILFMVFDFQGLLNLSAEEVEHFLWQISLLVYGPVLYHHGNPVIIPQWC